MPAARPTLVSVKTQPTGQTCTLSSNASGTITSNITVTATCVTNNYTIGAAVSGLTGRLVLQNNGGTISRSPRTTDRSPSAYTLGGIDLRVTVLTQPTDRPARSPTAAARANGTCHHHVAATSDSTTYTISVAVTGLTGTLTRPGQQVRIAGPSPATRLTDRSPRPYGSAVSTYFGDNHHAADRTDLHTESATPAAPSLRTSP